MLCASTIFSSKLGSSVLFMNDFVTIHNPSVYYQDYKLALTVAYFSMDIQNSRPFVVKKFDFDTKMKRVCQEMHANYLIK